MANNNEQVFSGSCSCGCVLDTTNIAREAKIEVLERVEELMALQAIDPRGDAYTWNKISGIIAALLDGLEREAATERRKE